MSGGLYGLDHKPGSSPRLLLPGLQPTALAVDPSDPRRIYCSTYNRGLWRSDDAGETWRAVGTPQSYYGRSILGAIAQRETTFVSVAPHRRADGRHSVWVGTERSSLYVSADHGHTFRLVTDFQEQSSRRNWSFPPRPDPITFDGSRTAKQINSTFRSSSAPCCAALTVAQISRNVAPTARWIPTHC